MQIRMASRSTAFAAQVQSVDEGNCRGINGEAPPKNNSSTVAWLATPAWREAEVCRRSCDRLPLAQGFQGGRIGTRVSRLMVRPLQTVLAFTPRLSVVGVTSNFLMPLSRRTVESRGVLIPCLPGCRQQDPRIVFDPSQEEGISGHTHTLHQRPIEFSSRNKPDATHRAR